MLNNPFIFNIAMRTIGYDKAMAELVKRYLKPLSGCRILDIGCGTSLILNYLPYDVMYYGFDLNDKYISRSRDLYRNRPNCEFYCRAISEYDLERADYYDIVVALSVIHHLNDSEASKLVRIARSALKVGGRFVSYDPVYCKGQGWFERFLMSKDRGHYIRKENDYLRVINAEIPSAQGDIRRDMGWRIPGSALIVVGNKDR